jgi:hypothetical protein
MCIVPVPVQLYSSTGYLVPVPVRSGERRARAFIHTTGSRSNLYPDNTKTGVIFGGHSTGFFSTYY